jgi:exodeoxyribonuclease V alpha subunit
LLKRCARILELPPPVVAQALASLSAQGWIKSHRQSEGEPFHLRPRYDRAEARIAEDLARILAAQPAARFARLEAKLAELERASGIYLDPEQREAVTAALRHKVLILTGGPGTGKTTIIRFILGLAGEAKTLVALAAPTGKAAKRMAEATGHPASTIHRLLEAGRDGFGRNEERPIEADLVIIDESSMIDTLLMEALLRAVPPAARLVLVGDVDQLPSVGAGMVLEDLITSGRFPVVRLERIHRQSQRSRITSNAHRIRRGEGPDLSRPLGDELSDFYFMPEADPERIVALIMDFVIKHIPRRFELDAKADIQVLTPMHKGLTGAQNLNHVLQATLNPRGEELSFGDRRFRVGDRVMQIRNDYEKEVFNGDMGEITRWDPEEDRIEVKFDDREVPYARKELDQLVLGYAITVHKAQGSEYPAVVLPLTTHHAIMLQRNLLYTAITRGRRLVVLIGTERAVSLAVRNARRDPRFTCLRPRLLEALPVPSPPAAVHAAGLS